MRSTPQNTSHPVKATDITIAYPSTGPQSGYAVVHATGCRHASRRSNYGQSHRAGTEWAPLADDWFHVAPCAR